MASLMILCMLFGGISVLFGIYAEIGGLIIAIYCVIGFFVHRNYAKIATHIKESSYSCETEYQFHYLADLAIVGHQTSSQKNIIICAVGLFLNGSGPFSVTDHLGPYFFLHY